MRGREGAGLIMCACESGHGGLHRHQIYLMVEAKVVPIVFRYDVQRPRGTHTWPFSGRPSALRSCAGLSINPTLLPSSFGTMHCPLQNELNEVCRTLQNYGRSFGRHFFSKAQNQVRHVVAAQGAHGLPWCGSPVTPQA